MKVGDKVKAISDRYEITNKDNGYIGTVIKVNSDNSFDVETIEGYCKGTRFYNLAPEYFEVISEKTMTIHITISESTVTAVLKEDDTVIGKTEVKCSPDDTFDAATGAKLAIDSLFTHKEEKSWLKTYDDVENHLGISREEWDQLRCKKVRFVKVFDGDSISVSDGDDEWVFLNSSFTGELLS